MAVKHMKDELRGSFHVLEFMGLVDGVPPSAVYRHDIKNCVGQCDVFVAIADEPSTGLGYELAVAVEVRRVPTLVLVQEGKVLTRLVRGACVENSHAVLMRYTTCTDIAGIIKAWATEIPVLAETA